MKFYYVSTSSNYPNKKYGILSSKEDDLEYLSFSDNDKIETIFDVKFDNKPDFNKWNIFPVNKVHIFLVDDKIKALLEDICKDEFEFVNVNLTIIEDSIKLQGQLLHVLNHNKKSGNIYYDRGIYVSELFKKEYIKRKLKGWIFYDEE